MSYDYAIVGGGPTGLALAQILNTQGKKVILFERANTLGGCHRITRVPVAGENLFAHHSPVVYTSAYKNFKTLLENMGTSFDALFTPYKFPVSQIGGFSASKFKIHELVAFLIVFVASVILPFPSSASMNDFMTTFRFSDPSRDFVNRLCLLTDGAAADRYTLDEFMSLAEQLTGQTFQPRFSHDSPNGLFTIWGKCLEDRGVTIFRACAVRSLDGTSGSSTVKSINTQKGRFIAENFVLAIPPEQQNELLASGDFKDAFGPIEQAKEWGKQTAYADYVPICFHWATQLDLPRVWGFPASDWGIAWIVLTDYMSFDEPSSKTVLSVSVTMLDKQSPFTNQTANNSSFQQIIDETLRQLRETFPNLPDPTQSIIPPHIFRSETTYESTDTAFVSTKHGFKKAQGSVPNLFSVGTHNGNSSYRFTSLESAVSNAFHAAHKMVPNSRRLFPFRSTMTAQQIIRIILLIVLGIALARRRVHKK